MFWRGVAFLEEPQCFFYILIINIVYSLLLIITFIIFYYNLAMATDDRKSHIKFSQLCSICTYQYILPGS